MSIYILIFVYSSAEKSVNIKKSQSLLNELQTKFDVMSQKIQTFNMKQQEVVDKIFLF